MKYQKGLEPRYEKRLACEGYVPKKGLYDSRRLAEGAVKMAKQVLGPIGILPGGLAAIVIELLAESIPKPIAKEDALKAAKELGKEFEAQGKRAKIIECGEKHPFHYIIQAYYK